MSVFAAVMLAILVNLAAYAAFGLDKRLARASAWRVSEGTLLGLALIGGSIGAKTAQHHFRHKTVKEPFRTQLDLIIALQVVVVVAGVVLWPGPSSWRDGLVRLISS